MAAEYSFIQLVMITVGIADVLGIILSVFVGFFISRRLLKPIDKITKTAKEISISDLNKRIDVGDNDDELSRLARTFNEMIERLKLSFEKQNQFVSDASHELRTPIAVIRGYIDLIDRWGKDDKKVLQESVDAIKGETKAMGELVEKLLFLARSETGTLNLNKEMFDLNELVIELIAEYSIIAPNQPICPDVQEEINVYADRRLMKQVLRALVDNSIKYSPKHETITIRTETGGNEIKLSVKDSGIGIAPDLIKEIFERFYRADSARTRETGGTGLGLSIVDAIIKAHDGRTIVESQVGEGTAVTVVLPMNA